MTVFSELQCLVLTLRCVCVRGAGAGERETEGREGNAGSWAHL